jgi:hypothetical protein
VWSWRQTYRPKHEQFKKAKVPGLVSPAEQIVAVGGRAPIPAAVGLLAGIVGCVTTLTGDENGWDHHHLFGR